MCRCWAESLSSAWRSPASPRICSYLSHQSPCTSVSTQVTEWAGQKRVWPLEMFEKYFAFIRWPHSQDLHPHLAEVTELREVRSYRWHMGKETSLVQVVFIVWNRWREGSHQAARGRDVW